jgi:hypothetical protein
MICAACPNDHGIRSIQLVNGTFAWLCARCERAGIALVRDPFAASLALNLNAQEGTDHDDSTNGRPALAARDRATPAR